MVQPFDPERARLEQLGLVVIVCASCCGKTHYNSPVLLNYSATFLFPVPARVTHISEKVAVVELQTEPSCRTRPAAPI